MSVGASGQWVMVLHRMPRMPSNSSVPIKSQKADWQKWKRNSLVLPFVLPREPWEAANGSMQPPERRRTLAGHPRRARRRRDIGLWPGGKTPDSVISSSWCRGFVLWGRDAGPSRRCLGGLLSDLYTAVDF